MSELARKLPRRLRTLAVGLSASALVLVTPGGAVASGAGAADTQTPERWRDNPRVSESSGSSRASYLSAWTTNSVKRPNHYNAVEAETNDDTFKTRVNAPGTSAEFGNFQRSEWVFSEWRPGRPANLYRSSLYGDQHVGFPPAVNTSASEFDPTLGGPWLLFTRYSVRNDRHKVLLFNRVTKRLRTLATASGDAAVYAGQVRGDYATWYSWGPERSNVFRYRISTKRAVRVPRPARFARQHNSSVGADGTVYYQRRRGVGCGRGAQLVMYPRGGPVQVLYDYPARKDGGRTVLEVPPVGPYLTFTMRKCDAPSARATGVYSVEVPANPAP